MKKLFYLVAVVFSLGWFLVSAQGVWAGRCLCGTDYSGDAKELFKNQGSILGAICVDAGAETDCALDKMSATVKDKYKPQCTFFDLPEDCEAKADIWEEELEKKIEEGTKASAGGGASTGSSGPGKISSLVGKCGEDSLPQECKDVTIFVSLLLDIVKYLFGIVGGIALGVFVYGGFRLILSQGNPEKVKAGTGALINAVIGLVIAFSGYLLISFIAQTVGLKGGF